MYVYRENNIVCMYYTTHWIFNRFSSPSFHVKRLLFLIWSAFDRISNKQKYLSTCMRQQIRMEYISGTYFERPKIANDRRQIIRKNWIEWIPIFEKHFDKFFNVLFWLENSNHHTQMHLIIIRFKLKWNWNFSFFFHLFRMK